MSQGERDKPSGQFTPTMDRVCACGHKLGAHSAGGALKERYCMAHDLPGGPDEMCTCEGFRAVKRKKNPRRCPPHLKKYLFKAGHVPKKARRRIRNPSGYSRLEVARLRRALQRDRLKKHKTAGRSPMYIITADRAGKRYPFDGRHFSDKHAARRFPSQSEALTKGRALIKQFPVLRGYALHVRIAPPLHRR